MKRRVWRGVLVLVSLVLVSTPVVAQVLYGSIVGTVTDSSDLAVPGATVTITHAETNQARETTTNETGNYTFPNVAAGTYRVDVTLPGFQSFRAQDIAVRLNAAVRVDAKLNVGALSGVGARVGRRRAAADGDRGGADADDEPAAAEPADQRPKLPERADADARRGAAELLPDGRHQQPRARDAGVGQRRAELEHGLPSRRRQRDEPVDSEPAGLHAGHRGDRDGQRRHQQLRRRAGHGRRRVGERADQERHEHAARIGLRVPDPRQAARPATTSCRPTSKKTKDNKSVFGGTIGGPIKRDKLFYFASVESTVQRTIGGPYVSQASGSASQFLSLPPAAIRNGNFSGTGTVIYDPATGNDHRHRPRALRLCQLRHHLDDRPAVRLVQLHPGEPDQPGREEHSGVPAAADAAGQREQLFRRARLQAPISTRSTRR